MKEEEEEKKYKTDKNLRTNCEINYQKEMRKINGENGEKNKQNYITNAQWFYLLVFFSNEFHKWNIFAKKALRR